VGKCLFRREVGLGNQVTNSSAVQQGTESILMAYERIKIRSTKRILAGSTSDSGPIFGVALML
jgi:hypothetical protein